MSRTASHILNDLELRIASLEEDSVLESLRQMLEGRLTSAKVTLRKRQKKVGVETPFATCFLSLENGSYKVRVKYRSMRSDALDLLESLGKLNKTVEANGGVMIGLQPLAKLKGTEGGTMGSHGMFVYLLKQKYGRNVGYFNHNLTANLGYVTFSFSFLENDEVYAVPKGMSVMYLDTASQAVSAVEKILSAVARV